MASEAANSTPAPAVVHVAPEPVKSGAKLCILAVVDQSYQRYLPTLACTALRAYPDCTVVLATDYRFRWRVRRALRPLLEIGDLRLMEHVFDGYPAACQEDFAVRRFLFDHPVLHEFDYVYIPDTDLFMCPEQPSLVEQHVARARQFDLPYSNVLRPTELPRLHGWHFIITEPYFRIMKPVLDRYREQLLRRELPPRINDEHLLQRMVVEAGLALPPQGTLFVGYHGLHLGRWSKRFLKRRARRQPAFTTPLEHEHMHFYLRHKNDAAYEPGIRLIRRDLKHMEAEFRAAPPIAPSHQ